MEGTNYIDHRFPCGDMVRWMDLGELGCSYEMIDIHGRMMYVVIYD